MSKFNTALVPAAALLTLVGCLRARDAIGVLRQGVFALFLGFSTVGIYRVDVLRLVITSEINNSVSDTNFMTGLALAYVAFVLMTAIICAFAPSHALASRSPKAALFFILTFASACTGCGLYWHNLDADEVTDYAPATLVSLMTLFGSILFIGDLGAATSLIITTLRSFWSLSFALSGIDRSAFGLMFAAAVLTIIAAAVFMGHNNKTSGYARMLNYIDPQRTMRFYVISVLSIILLVGGDVLIYFYNTNQNTSLYFQSGGFAFAAFIVFLSMMTPTSTGRSHWRYLFFGLFMYIPIYSTQSVYNVYNNSIDLYTNPSSPTYGHSNEQMLFIGQVVGYVGLTGAFDAIAGNSRRVPCGASAIFYILSFCLTVGGSVLVFMKNSYPSQELQLIIQTMPVPMGVALYILYHGIWHQCHEAVNAALFVLFYAAIWSLPLQYEIKSIIGIISGSSTRFFVGSCLIFAAAIASIIAAIRAAGHHIEEIVCFDFLFIVI